MGLSFITEGAIPFAAADPLRVIPSMMVGSGVGGAIALALGSRINAPHGGIIVIAATDFSHITNINCFDSRYTCFSNYVWFIETKSN